MAKRGRPTHSNVRQNIIEILARKPMYGYELARTYVEIFPAVTMRAIYYHLKKGAQSKEFKVERVEKSEGSFSWGPASQHVIYGLGEAAEPRGDSRVEAYFAGRQSPS